MAPAIISSCVSGNALCFLLSSNTATNSLSGIVIPSTSNSLFSYRAVLSLMSETNKKSKTAFSSNAAEDGKKTEARGDGFKGKRRRYAAAVGSGVGFVAAVQSLCCYWLRW